MHIQRKDDNVLEVISKKRWIWLDQWGMEIIYITLLVNNEKKYIDSSFFVLGCVLLLLHCVLNYLEFYWTFFLSNIDLLEINN